VSDRPLRVLLALESSGPGGAENMVVTLAAALRGLGDQPVVATDRPGWMTERAAAEGLPVWIETQRPGVDVRWILRLARRIRRERIDFVHSHEFSMNVFGGAAALLARRPALSTIHGRSWVAERPRRIAAYRVLRGLGIPIAAVSRDLAGYLAGRFRLPLKALRVVHNGIPLPPLPPAAERPGRRAAARAALGIPPDGPLLVAVGNLYPVKDHANLLRAVARLEGPARVAIAGRGEEEESLRRLAAELGLSERLHLLGLRDDVDRVLWAGDVFVQPSRSEGLPLAVLEAMTFALPIVATRVGGLGEAIADGTSGRLVPPGDPAALAAALSQVLDSGDRGAGLGAAARARAGAGVWVGAMVRSYRGLYREGLERSRPRRAVA
jgi:glycosyltransferase involved in cell wall biosynthesis